MLWHHYRVPMCRANGNAVSTHMTMPRYLHIAGHDNNGNEPPPPPGGGCKGGDSNHGIDISDNCIRLGDLSINRGRRLL